MVDDAHTPEKRFSDRVANYVRYRPSYPAGILEILERDAGLLRTSTIADIGSGTGIFAEYLLRHDLSVIGVEPNREMRNAAEGLLAGYPRFRSLEGTAESTTLPDASIDLIVAAQAFHWFRPSQTRAEFTRIMRAESHVALIWNVRQVDSTPFLRAYENLLVSHATDYSQVRHENIGAQELGSFFKSGSYTRHTLPNAQRFDFEGLKGRLLSSSYAPANGHPGHEAMMEELAHIFDKHQSRGEVCFEYDTELYIGS